MLLRLLILAGLLALVPAVRAGAQVRPAGTMPVGRSTSCRTRRSATSSSRRSQTIAQKPQPAACTGPGNRPDRPRQSRCRCAHRRLRLPQSSLQRDDRRLGAIRSVPLFWRWLTVMATDPQARGVLLDTAWRLVVILAVGLWLEWGVRRAIRRPIVALARRAPRWEPPRVEEDAVARAELWRDRSRRGTVRRDHGADIAPPCTAGARPSSSSNCCRSSPSLSSAICSRRPLSAARTPPRLVLLAVIDAYALCVSILLHCAGDLFAPIPAAPPAGLVLTWSGCLRHPLDQGASRW